MVIIFKFDTVKVQVGGLYKFGGGGGEGAGGTVAPARKRNKE